MSIWITTPPQVMPSGSCSPCGTGALSSEVSHLENRPGPCHGRIGVRYQPIQLHTARGNWWKCPQTPEPHDPSSVTYVSALTTHDLEPSRSRTQSAFSWHGLGDPSGQKRCPRRWQPDVWSPTKPGWQGPHWKDPCAQARSVSRSHHPLPRQDKYWLQYNPCMKNKATVGISRFEIFYGIIGAHPVGILVFTVSLLVKLNIKENKLI